MIHRYSKDTFAGENPPTESSHTVIRQYQGKQVELDVLDYFPSKFETPSQCFIVCFSLRDSTSFANAKIKWLNEIKELSTKEFPNTDCPKLLVGLQKTLPKNVWESEIEVDH
jgi:GTPase SAR1 family protein